MTWSGKKFGFEIPFCDLVTMDWMGTDSVEGKDNETTSVKSEGKTEEVEEGK